MNISCSLKKITLRSCKYIILLVNKKNDIIRYFIFVKMNHFFLVNILFLLKRIIFCEDLYVLKMKISCL